MRPSRRTLLSALALLALSACDKLTSSGKSKEKSRSSNDEEDDEPSSKKKSKSAKKADEELARAVAAWSLGVAMMKVTMGRMNGVGEDQLRKKLTEAAPFAEPFKIELTLPPPGKAGDTADPAPLLAMLNEIAPAMLKKMEGEREKALFELSLKLHSLRLIYTQSGEPGLLSAADRLIPKTKLAARVFQPLLDKIRARASGDDVFAELTQLDKGVTEAFKQESKTG